MKPSYCLLSALWLLAQIPAPADTVTNSSPATLTRWERSAGENRQLTTNITWLTHEPLVFLMRRGDHFNDEPDRYARMSDPENIKRMADAGVRYAMIYFYKGFGLEYERPSMSQASRPSSKKNYEQAIKDTRHLPD